MFFHSLCTVFEINLEDTFARLEKTSSKLDVFRSLIRIFAPTHQSTQWAGGADILERTFTNVISRSSNLASLTTTSRDTATGTFTSGVYYTLLIAVWLWAMVVYKLHGVG